MTPYSYKSYGYFIIYLLITAQFFSDHYNTTDPVDHSDLKVRYCDS